MRLSFHSILLIILIACGSRASAATLHVPADFPTIQSCIHAAVSGQDECVVAPGTYNELINFLGKAITVRSSHGSATTILDGSGLGDSIVQFGATITGESTLQGFTLTKGIGRLIGSARRGGAIYADLSHAAIRDSYFLSNTAGSGGAIYNSGTLTLERCSFSQNTAQFGGAICNASGSVSELSDCQFALNHAANGGAISNNSSSQTLIRCMFSNNTSAEGGAIRNLFSTVDLLDCDFLENKASLTHGGAMANGPIRGIPRSASESDRSAASTFDFYTISGGSFVLNESAGLGGAIYDNGRATVIRNVFFDRNTATIAGGAVFSQEDETRFELCGFVLNRALRGGAISGSGEVRSCEFAWNTAHQTGGGVEDLDFLWDCYFLANSADRGGACFNVREVQNSEFIRNAATGPGGAISRSAAISNSFFAANHAELEGGAVHLDTASRITNSAFVGNSANFGGAIYNGHSLSAHSSTLTQNRAADSGGGIANLGGESTAFALTVSNSIVWGNIATHGPQLWINEKVMEATSYFSDLEGSGGSSNWNLGLGVDGGGNVDLDPLFVREPSDGGDGWRDDPSTSMVDESANDDYGDLRLQSSSPCINAGDPDFLPQAGETDLDGHARVLCGRVDMGAYEIGIGDFDCDQAVTLADFSAWPSCSPDPYHSQALQSTSENRQSRMGTGCEALDFEYDGDVDLRDFAAWQNLFDQ